jgi:hypothetical protein
MKLGPAPIGERQASEPTWVMPNAQTGAVFVYSVAQALPGDARIVLSITDSTGREVRRLDVPKQPGVRRLVWNLRGDPSLNNVGASPAAAGRGRGGRGGGAAGPTPDPQSAAAQARGGNAQAEAQGRGANAQGETPQPPPQGRGGFGGQASFVDPGRYTATLMRVEGEQSTPLGKPQSFQVMTLPAKNY